MDTIAQAIKGHSLEVI